MYFLMFGLGIVFFSISLIYIIQMYDDRKITFSKGSKTIAILSLGIFLLIITLPSLKYILFREYVQLDGACAIDIDTSARTAEASFEILDTGEIFSFRDIPELDIYGKKAPYYCTLTVTKDHNWEIGYKIYDLKTKELIVSNE